MDVHDSSQSIKTIIRQIVKDDITTQLLAIFGVILLSHYCRKFIRRKSRKQPPGPVGIPFFGYYPFLGKDVLKTFSDLKTKYGSVFSLYLGQKYIVVINEWEDKKRAFNESALNNRPPELFSLLPNGLGVVGNNGAEWREQRRFCMKTLKDIGFGRPSYEKLLQEEVKDVVKRVEACQGQAIDVPELFSTSFTNSIMSLLLGYRLPYNHTITKRVSHALDSIMFVFPVFEFINFSPTLCNFLAKFGLYGNPEDVKQLKEFNAFIEDIVQKQLQTDEANEQESFIKKYNQEVENNKKNNLNNSFTDSSLYGNSQVMLLAGSDTTKDTTIWLLIAMAEFPEVQAKVHDELDREVGRDGEINWSMRPQIPYTYACILESMRWKTLAPLNLLRTTSEDMEISGYHVPKDTIIISNNWAMHYDTNYWPNPEKFDPERFLVEGGKQVNTKLDSYTPFSNGKRNCPGEQIAVVNVLTYFARFMQKFTILPDGEKVTYGAILSLSYKPVNVKLRFIPLK